MGTNDVIADACGPDQVAAGILSIVEQLRIRRPDAWIVVQSLLPSKKAEPFVVNSINEATKCLTDSTRKMFFFNSSNVFMSSSDAVDADLFFEDGVHPNVEGSEQWARAMVDFLRMLYSNRYYL